MKKNCVCFILSAMLFLGIQSACLFTKTNIWLAQFIIVKQQQIQQLLAIQKAKNEQKKSEQEVQETLPIWDKQVRDFTKILTHLEDAKQKQQLREEQLNQLELQLKNEREALNVLKQSIEILQSELKNRLTKVEASEVKNLKTLAEAYSNMTPESVAKIFAESEESTIIKIMHFIAPETLGAILQIMAKDIVKEKENGAKISHLLESFRLSEGLK